LFVLLATVSPLLGCEDILPVETIHRCEGDDPPDDCSCADGAAQLDDDIGPRAAVCPECQGSNPHADCENAPAVVDSGTDGGGDAGTGGTGATAGAAADAGPCASCPDAQPLCFEGNECVECVDHGDCDGVADRCEPQAHACVQCLADADCDGNTPRCDLDAHVCAECLSNSDCGAAEPVCGADHRCQDCSDDSACEDRDGTERCDTRPTSATSGGCVQCLSHDDCANPTPQCGNGTCQPCTDDVACASHDGSEVCNTLAGAETEGQCVECTGPTEEDRCGDNACKRSTGECTDVERGSLLACRACNADSECVAQAKCAPHDFGGQLVGTFCFFEDGSTSNCAAMDSARRPYSRSTALTSVDGAEGNYCLPITTCKAVEDAVAMGASGGKACVGSADCGEPGVSDGDCPDSGGAMDRCSYQCDDDFDCPVIGFTHCGGSGADLFCQP
jgi:hypothetical protein